MHSAVVVVLGSTHTCVLLELKRYKTYSDQAQRGFSHYIICVKHVPCSFHYGKLFEAMTYVCLHLANPQPISSNVGRLHAAGGL